MGATNCCMRKEEPIKTTGMSIPAYNLQSLEENQNVISPPKQEPQTVYQHLIKMHNSGEENLSLMARIIEEETLKDPVKMKNMREKPKKRIGKNVFWKYVEQITGKKKKNEEEN